MNHYCDQNFVRKDQFNKNKDIKLRKIVLSKSKLKAVLNTNNHFFFTADVEMDHHGLVGDDYLNMMGD